MLAKFRSKKEIVYDLLRENILTGVYQPGTRLVIDDLATKLKVSQIPIREALGQLEADGFITTEPYVGPTVTPIDANSVSEIFGLLESMEIISSCAACATMTEHDLKSLTQMVNEMDKLLDKPDEWARQNQTLHLFICEIAQTVLIHKMMQKVFDHWDRLRMYYLKDVSTNRLGDAQTGHKQMIEAFKARDAEAVERVIREHNQSAIKSYMQHLEAAKNQQLKEG
ncbi:MAG: GntR family transcriptional regulator [Anaerolineae bacterium]|nr:GntR family transcriptional regulator [Anaerolineae bacterium]